MATRKNSTSTKGKDKKADTFTPNLICKAWAAQIRSRCKSRSLRRRPICAPHGSGGDENSGLLGRGTGRSFRARSRSIATASLQERTV